MTKIKIAFVISGLRSGGAERVVSTLANELTSRYQVHIITLKKSEPFYPLDPAVRLSYCMENIRPSRHAIQAIRTNLGLIWSLKKILRHESIQYCISFTTIPNLIAVPSCRVLGIPIIISERNNPLMDGASLRGVWKWLRTRFYPKADFLVVQTRGIAGFYSALVRENRLRIIPNPLNPDFNYTPESQRKNIVLNVGRLHYQKNQETLIRAFSRIDHSDWELHIYGHGPEREALIALAEKMGVSDRVKLPGPYSPISDKYTESSIFAFTSLFEGFPNALMEAMYFGLACISTDCPTGPSELIQNGINGYLIPVGGEDELTHRLTELMSDAKLRKEIGRKAHESMTPYKSEEVIGEWVNLLESLKPNH